ncbi:MAG: MFS transporter [Crocinitomicaceae bacterium]|nr:MFS transporter [Crocinitomicaceae bacterium]MDP4722922.1 MFS transporter [Crocinitomicaceae bacterium]MDP4799289.1 MFS transporter [Crocinitomicaceae bacterium]MDP4806848.1 MFS transporter [Crocinitomicaceae bacterium]MDP4867946.1 MFS transporter [Crocinitomicaceae bacterium]
MNLTDAIKTRLTLLSFFQFFVWGAWLTTIGTYCTEGKGWSFPQFGAVFSTLALSSILMPSIIGIIADKWLRAERLYGILHLTYGVFMLLIPQIDYLQEAFPAMRNFADYELLYWLIFGGMLAYMPSISLSNSVSYRILKMNNLEVQKDFPKIRVWGTIGFIAAMWLTNLSGSKASANQFYIAGVGAILLGLYAFTLPACHPQGKTNEKKTLAQQFGLDAFKLFAQYRMALFFIFSILLGAALQLSNMYGDAYLSSFPKGTLVEKYSTIIYSISQVSETIFILTIPFFLKRFGIKNVMLFALLAWVLRYGFFAYGSTDFGVFLIVMSCIVYGMAFDFFLISGSMFVEANTDSSIRSSAQGLFIMMTNGIGAYIGTVASSALIGAYYILPNGQTDWQGAWLLFAGYSLVVAILFVLLFKEKQTAAA